jgi:tungstate transport system permease protein
VSWLTNISTQEKIYAYGIEQFGQTLFYPNSDYWRQSEDSASIQGDIEGQQRLGDSNIMESMLMILQGDQGLLEIVVRTLQVSGSALLLACFGGIPLGVYLGLANFRGKRAVELIIYTGMGLPPVVVGLVLFLLLSNGGPLGWLQWLFTLKGMILAQTVLAFPLASGLTASSVKGVSQGLIWQVRSLGATRWQERWTVLRQARMGVIAAILAAFGRIISEVGAVMLVGGNIAGNTRVLSTAIILETRQGAFGLAMALGLMLLGVALLSNAFVLRFRGRWRQ